MPRATRRDAVRSTRFSFRAQLRLILEIPLDILFEVVSRLPPSDVLSLSRTSKVLRSVLMSRSAITAWRESLKNEPDLPPLPSGLTEPQFANLLYSDHCHYCSATPATCTLWGLYVRCCDPCLAKNFAPLDTVLSKYRDPLKNYKELLCIINSPTGPRASLSDAALVNSRLLQVKSKKPELDAYLKERRQHIRERIKFADGCQDYMAKRRRRLRQERKEAVYDRLTQIGFGYEVQRIRENGSKLIDDQPAVNSEEPLTETAWSRMKNALIEIMEDVREKLLKKQKKSLLKKRIAIINEILKDFRSTHSNEGVTVPPLVDVCAMPPVMAILFDENRDAYVQRDHYVNFLTGLPQWCCHWQAEKADLLAKLVQAQSYASSNWATLTSKAVLELATTYFKCNECLAPFTYPAILTHECLIQLSHGYRNRGDDEVMLFKMLNAEPWNLNGRRVSFSKNAHMIASSLVRVAGLDPLRAKASQMDGVELACSLCKRGNLQKHLPWRKAVLHEINHTLVDNKTPTWSTNSPTRSTQVQPMNVDPPGEFKKLPSHNIASAEIVDLTMEDAPGSSADPIVVD
ncbi:hypothetical protein AX16_004738 [Volvariella volvacea WC 439]|nr:hypothetical protein AX16_004738 [Volvariella volvacea WC 439]